MTVFLVGAGPGDPGLITVRGLDLVRRADVLVLDRLAGDQLPLEAKPDCLLIDAGKAPGRVAMTQDEINACLVEHGRTGALVVRLKGGDPFLFGRGGEEAAHLVRHGVPVEVVPGVTAGIAAPAYAGIPVTHRSAGSSVTFVTGHEEIDKGRPGVDWRGLARSSDGLVIYMGLHNLRRICAELLAGGLSAETPAAVVQQGTVVGQRLLLSTLAELADQAEQQGFASPAIVVVGQVVSQRVAACSPEPAAVEMPIPF